MPRALLLLSALASAACGGAPAPARSVEGGTEGPAEDRGASSRGAAEPEVAETAGPVTSGYGAATEAAGAKPPVSDAGGESRSGAPAAATETRTMAVIQKVILDHRQQFRDCYERGKKELPGLRGTLTLHFVLDAEGKVKKAEHHLERSDIKAPVVVSCALDALRKLTFPPSSRGMDTEVNYPFDFKP